MKKTLIASTIAAILAISAGTAFAHERDRQADMGERFDYIFTQLELTDDQRTAVLEALESTMEAQRDAMWDTKQSLRDREERPTREEMQALMETHRAAMTQALTDELNLVLSPDVTADFVEYLEAHAGPQGKGGPGHHDKGGEGQGKRY